MLNAAVGFDYILIIISMLCYCCLEFTSYFLSLCLFLWFWYFILYIFCACYYWCATNGKTKWVIIFNNNDVTLYISFDFPSFFLVLCVLQHKNGVSCVKIMLLFHSICFVLPWTQKQKTWHRTKHKINGKPK